MLKTLRYLFDLHNIDYIIMDTENDSFMYNTVFHEKKVIINSKCLSYEYKVGCEHRLNYTIEEYYSIIAWDIVLRILAFNRSEELKQVYFKYLPINSDEKEKKKLENIPTLLSCSMSYAKIMRVELLKLSEELSDEVFFDKMTDYQELIFNYVKQVNEYLSDFSVDLNKNKKITYSNHEHISHILNEQAIDYLIDYQCSSLPYYCYYRKKVIVNPLLILSYHPDVTYGHHSFHGLDSFDDLIKLFICDALSLTLPKVRFLLEKDKMLRVFYSRNLSKGKFERAKNLHERRKRIISSVSEIKSEFIKNHPMNLGIFNFETMHSMMMENRNLILDNDKSYLDKTFSLNRKIKNLL